MIKLNILIKRLPGLTLEEFRKHWKEIHGPLFSSQPIVKQHVLRYVQAHSTGDSVGQFPVVDFDGIAQIWFENLAGVTAVFGSDNYRKDIAPDEKKFIDIESVLWIYSTEHIVIE